MTSSQRRLIVRAMVAAVLVVGVGLGWWLLRPPAATGTNRAAAQDTVDRVAAMLGGEAAPHPAGSPEQAKVRDRLLAWIEDEGLDATTEHIDLTKAQALEGLTALGNGWQDSLEYVPFNGSGVLPMDNILVKKASPAATNAVMLVAHYDSTADGPGATDDMLSVVAAIKAVAAAGTTPATNLYVLLTDAEEDGMLGAWAFLQANPEMREQVGRVYNFEARGNAGALLMFQASPNDLGLMREYAAAAPHPVASSLTAQLLEMMPNDSDFSRFLDAKYEGLNFAAIDGWWNYHEPTDSAENIPIATSAHYTQTAQGLADYWYTHQLTGNRVTGWTVLGGTSAGTAAYFPVLPGRLAVVPTGWLVIASVAALVLVVAVGVWSLLRSAPARRRHILTEITRGSVRLVLCLVVAALVGAALVAASYLPQWPVTPWLGALVAVPVVLAAVGSWRWSIRRRTRNRGRRGSVSRGAVARGHDAAPWWGAAPVWTVLGVTGAVLMPRIAYLWVIPALGWAVAVVLHRRPWAVAITMACTSLVALVLTVPAILLTNTALIVAAPVLTMPLAVLAAHCLTATLRVGAAVGPSASELRGVEQPAQVARIEVAVVVPPALPETPAVPYSSNPV